MTKKRFPKSRVKGKFVFLVFALLFFGLLTATQWEKITSGDFNNGTYFQTILDAGNFVRLANASNEMPNNQAYNSTTGINMTQNVLLMHMNQDWIDYSGIGNHGSAFNGVTFSTSTYKLANASGSFDGVDDFVYVSDSNSLDFISRLTISAWIYPKSATTDNTGGNGMMILEKESTGFNGYWLSVKSTGNLSMIGKSAIITSSATVPINTWSHVVANFNGSTTQFYVNGQYIDSSTTITSFGANTEAMGIGIRDFGNNRFNGTIDELALWNRSLSATEISNIYMQQYGRYYNSGNYTSEIKDFSSSQIFNNLSWTPQVPYQQELPNNQAVESVYGGANMTGNVLLLHMNELINGTEFPNSQATANDMNMTGNVLNLHMNNDWVDSSSGINNATATGTTFTTGSKLGSHAGALVTGSNLSIGSLSNGVYSFSGWYYFTDQSSISPFLLDARAGGGTGYIYFTNSSGELISSSGTIYLDGSSVTPNATKNVWHHVLVSGITINAPTNVYFSRRNAFSDNWYYLNASIDEVAIWNRTLTLSEVKNIFYQQEKKFVDNSGLGNNGTAKAGITLTTSSKLGSNAGNFNGLSFSNFKDITNLDGASYLSYSGWFKSSVSGNQMIIAKQYNSGGFYIRLSGSSNGKLEYGQYNNSNNFSVIYSDYSLNDSQWHNMFCVWNNSNTFIYIDGVKQSQVGNLVGGTFPNIADSLSVGANTDNGTISGSFFNGSIDEVAIWNRSLSATEIQNLYLRGAVALNLSVRSCDDSACSGESWNTTSSVSPVSLSSILGNNRYFQYKFDFFSDSTNQTTPQLYNVSLDYSVSDATPPSITVTSPTNTTYNTKNILVNITNSSDAVSTWWFNGTNNVTYASEIYFNFSEGSNIFYAYTNDSSNNVNTSSVTFLVDTIFPLVDFGVGTNSSGTNVSQNWIYVNVSLTEANEKNITFSLFNSTGQVNSTTFTTAIRTINWTSLSDGTYMYNVTVFDTIGNRNTSSTRTITLDNSVPLINLIFPNNKTSDNDGNLTFVFNATDTLAVLNCSLNFNNLLNQTNSSTIQNLNTLFQINSLAVGNYNWSINCTDQVGNSNLSETRFFSVSRTNNFSGSTTNLSGISDYTNITNFTIENPTYGKIVFNENISLSSGIDIDSFVSISSNRVEINSSGASGLNKSALLSLYGLTFSNPRILKDGVLCSSPQCVRISYSGGVLFFNVSSFSYYSAQETPSSGTSDSGNGGSGGGGTSWGKATGTKNLPVKLATECTLNSECRIGEICSKNQCVKLFDVQITEMQSLVKVGEIFNFSYFIKSMTLVNDDVNVLFWIEKDKKVLSSGHDVVFVGGREFNYSGNGKLLIPSDVESGQYFFYINVNRGSDINTTSYRTIEISVDEKTDVVTFEPVDEVKQMKKYVYILIGVVVLLLLVIVFAVILLEVHRARCHERKHGEKRHWLRNHWFSLVIVIFLVLTIVVFCVLNWLSVVTFSELKDFAVFVSPKIFNFTKAVISFAYSKNIFLYLFLGFVGIIAILIGIRFLRNRRKKHH